MCVCVCVCVCARTKYVYVHIKLYTKFNIIWHKVRRFEYGVRIEFQSSYSQNGWLVFLGVYVMSSINIETKAVFTQIEMNNDWNVNFL